MRSLLFFRTETAVQRFLEVLIEDSLNVCNVLFGTGKMFVMDTEDRR